jgi:hypothetical protein
MVEEEVLEHRELRNEREVLMNGLDPVADRVLDRSEVDLTPIEQDVTRIRAEQTAQDLDESALARSVVPDEAEHLALVQSEIDAAQYRQGAEALGHAPDFERRFAEPWPAL